MTTQSLLIIILTAAALSTTVGTLLGVITGFLLVTRHGAVREQKMENR